MWRQNISRTSCDALRADRHAGHVLDCWAAHHVSSAVHNKSHNVQSTCHVKNFCVLCAGQGCELTPQGQVPLYHTGSEEGGGERGSENESGLGGKIGAITWGGERGDGGGDNSALFDPLPPLS